MGWRLTDPEFIKRVTGREPEPPQPAQPKQVQPMATNTNDDFVPEQDIYRDLGDGRMVLEAARGVPIPRAEAERRGLLKADQVVGPSEVKAPEGAQIADAQARAAMIQNTGGAIDVPPHVMHDQMRANTAPDPEQAIKEPSATGTTSTAPGEAADEPADDGKKRKR